MKLDLGIMAGADSKAWLQGFTTQNDRLEKLLDRMEKIGSKTPVKVKAESEEDADEAEENLDNEEDDFAAKPAKNSKKKSADFDDDEDEIEDDDEDAEEKSDDEDESEVEEAPAAKKGRAKKVTVDDVNEACKMRARAGGKEGRAQVLGILKKKFKTESVSELEPDQWQACIDAMKVEQ